MWFDLLPAPLLVAGALLLAALLALLIIITAVSPTAARRILRLLEAIHHLVHGTCPMCGRQIKASTSRAKPTRRGW